MANWIYFILIAEVLWSFASLIDKIMFSKGYIKSPFVFIVFNGAMNILLIFLLPFFSLEPISIANFLVVLTTGLFLSLGVIFYYKAVQHEEISRVVMLWQLIPIFVLVLSFFFLEDTLKKNHFIGFSFLLIGGIVVAYKKINGSFKLSKAFYFMLGSTFFISAYYVLSKFAYKITSFWSAFMWLRVAAFAGIFVLLSTSIRKQFVETVKNMKTNAKALMGFKMLIDFSAFIFLGYAISTGPISLISALGSASAPVFIFIITLFTSTYFPHIVKEDINRKSILTKFLAIVLIIVGVVFVYR